MSAFDIYFSVRHFTDLRWNKRTHSEPLALSIKQTDRPDATISCDKLLHCGMNRLIQGERAPAVLFLSHWSRSCSHFFRQPVANRWSIGLHAYAYCTFWEIDCMCLPQTSLKPKHIDLYVGHKMALSRMWRDILWVYRTRSKLRIR